MCTSILLSSQLLNVLIVRGGMLRRGDPTCNVKNKSDRPGSEVYLMLT